METRRRLTACGRAPGRAVLLVLACAGAFACGARSGNIPGATDLGPKDGTRHEAWPPPEAGGDAQLFSDLVTSPTEGLIYLVEVKDSPSGAQQGAAYAFFTPRPMPFFSPVKALGTQCSLFPDDEVGTVQYSAGEISITGSAYAITLQPDKPVKPGDWLYPGMLYPEIFGQTTIMTVTAQGDQLPPFSGKLGGVGELKVTFPVGPLSRSKPLELKFPAFTGKVWAILTGVAAGGKSTGIVRCAGTAATGQIQVPAAALAALPSSVYAVKVRLGPIAEAMVIPSSLLRVHLIAAHLVEQTMGLGR